MAVQPQAQKKPSMLGIQFWGLLKIIQLPLIPLQMAQCLAQMKHHCGSDPILKKTSELYLPNKQYLSLLVILAYSN